VLVKYGASARVSSSVKVSAASVRVTVVEYSTAHVVAETRRGPSPSSERAVPRL
jgi:hypothetical protein